MRRIGWFLAVMALVGVFSPSLAQSEFYIGPYLGPSFASNVDPEWDYYKNSPGKNYVVLTRNAQGVRVDPSLLLGGKFGYWFTNKSVFGLQMPSWLKYFGFELDVSYQSLRWSNQDVIIQPVNFKQILRMDSTAVTVSFLVLARYGFFPDAEVPLGRLQPYIGVGPAIFVTNTFVYIGNDFRSTEADLGLAAEAGLRYMLYPRLSLYTAFRYRYLPSHTGADDRIFDTTSSIWSYVEMKTNYNMYDLMFGVAYHF